MKIWEDRERDDLQQALLIVKRQRSNYIEETRQLREQVKTLQADYDAWKIAERGLWAEIERLASLAEARLAVVRLVEWNTAPSDVACPVCKGEPRSGHAGDCALAAVLPDTDVD